MKDYLEFRVLWSKPHALWVENGQYHLIQKEEVFEPIIEKNGQVLATKRKVKFNLHIFRKDQIPIDFQ